MVDQRRARGTVVRPVTPGYKIAEESRDRIKSMADAAGVSPSHFVELMAEHTYSELTLQGIPSWLPPVERPEELPIDGP